MDRLKMELASVRSLVMPHHRQDVKCMHNTTNLLLPDFAAAGDQSFFSITDCCPTLNSFVLSIIYAGSRFRLSDQQLNGGYSCINVASTVQHSTCFGERIIKGFPSLQTRAKCCKAIHVSLFDADGPIGEVIYPYSLFQHFHMSMKRLSTRIQLVTALYVPFKVMDIG